jgi:hypothetical protein
MKNLPKSIISMLDIMSEIEFFNDMELFDVSKKIKQYKNFKLVQEFANQFDGEEREFAEVLFENQINYIDMVAEVDYTLSKETILAITKVVIKKLMVFRNIISVQPITSPIGTVSFNCILKEYYNNQEHDIKAKHYSTISTTFNNYDFFMPLVECQEPLTEDQIQDIGIGLYNKIACSIIGQINDIANKNPNNLTLESDGIDRNYLVELLQQQVRRIRYDTKQYLTGKPDYILSSFFGSIVFMTLLGPNNEYENDSLFWFEPVIDIMSNESLMHTGRLMAITPYDDTPFVLFDVFSTVCIEESGFETSMIISNNSDGYIFSPHILVEPTILDDNMYFCSNTASLVRDRKPTNSTVSLILNILNGRFSNSVNYFNKLTLR